ncbi:transposase, partial [Salmonella enterica subsp. enterica]|nr:transposase [Salmonella enterica subsp. enterica serovar Abaetetuba]
MEWVSTNELTSLSALPSAISSIHRRAKKQNWQFRKKEGGKGVAYEFLVSSLPLAIQHELRERHVAELMETEPQETAKPVVRRRRDPDAISPLEAYRGSPQLMEERLNALTENQRQVADARAALVREVFLLEEKGNIGRLKAINYVVSKARSGELPPL